MKKYYLLSLKWSKGADEYTWWGPNNSGYCTDINKAGVYSEEEINSRRLYYCNKGVMPIPVDLVQQAEKKTVVTATVENFDLFQIDEHIKTAKEY